MKTASIFLSAIVLAMPGLAVAGTMWVTFINAVPTLGEWGLISLAVGVGGLGAWLLSRKK